MTQGRVRSRPGPRMAGHERPQRERLPFGRAAAASRAPPPPFCRNALGGHVSTCNMWAEGSWAGARLTSQHGSKGPSPLCFGNINYGAAVSVWLIDLPGLGNS